MKNWNIVQRIMPVQYESISGTDINSIHIHPDNNNPIVAVYIGSYECPYVGAEYANGEYSICGMHIDSMVEKGTMVSIIASASVDG